MFTVPVYWKRVVLFHLWKLFTSFFIQVESALYSKIKASGVNLIKLLHYCNLAVVLGSKLQ